MEPILFQIGRAVVPSHSFMLSSSFIVGALIFICYGKKQNISINKLFGLVISVQLFAILGARFLFVVNNYSQFESDFLKVFSISPGGFAVNGGLFFGILVGVLYTRLSSLSFWNISDFASPSIALGICLTKIGCFLGGCCYGKETSLFLGVQFPDNSLAASQYGIPHLVHPTQLYEGFFGIIILVILLLVRRRRKFAGQVFLSFVILYLFVRTLNDVLRGDVTHNYIFNLSQTQLLSIIFGLLAVLIYWVRFVMKNKTIYGSLSHLSVLN